MYLNLTLVPLIQKIFQVWHFPIVNSFFISLPLKKKVCFLNAYFYFTFIIKPQNEFSCLPCCHFYIAVK